MISSRRQNRLNGFFGVPLTKTGKGLYHELNGIDIFWSEVRSQKTEAIADLIVYSANGD